MHIIDHNEKECVGPAVSFSFAHTYMQAKSTLPSLLVFLCVCLHPALVLLALFWKPKQRGALIKKSPFVNQAGVYTGWHGVIHRCVSVRVTCTAFRVLYRGLRGLQKFVLYFVRTFRFINWKGLHIRLTFSLSMI